MGSAEHPWASLLNGLGVPVLIWRRRADGPDGLALAYINPAGLESLRIDPEQWEGADFWAVMPGPAIMSRVGALYSAALEVVGDSTARHVRGVTLKFPEAPLDCLHFRCWCLSDGSVAMAGESPYKGYLDHSTDVFGVLSPSGEMLYVTPSAATKFGYAPEEVGMLIDGLVIDEPGTQALTEAWNYVSNHPNASRTVEFRRQGRDGSWLDMELIARDFRQDPAVGGVLFNSRDISQRKADERRILELNEDLEAFTYTVSHDLRLPLRLVSEALVRVHDDLGSQLTDRTRADLARAGELVRDMTALIQDLLAFSRTGSAALEHAEVDLSGMAHEVCDELAATGSTRRECFVIEDGLRTLGDRALLRQVLANLLGNAAKFSHHVAQPCIHFGGHADRAGATFFVRDNGLGFEQEQADQLFTVFRRGHQDPGIPGTGVGLAIVKRIVERHGGSVWAEGERGSGATFYFRLPAAAPLAKEEKGADRDVAEVHTAG